MYSISSSDKIKRCPCCGNQYPTEIRDNNTVYVHCDQCGFKTKEYYYTYKQKAIDEWNNSDSPWHTGTPTEIKGWYLLKYKWYGEIRYTTMQDPAITFFTDIRTICWQKIKETD